METKYRKINIDVKEYIELVAAKTELELIKKNMHKDFDVRKH